MNKPIIVLCFTIQNHLGHAGFLSVKNILRKALFCTDVPEKFLGLDPHQNIMIHLLLGPCPKMDRIHCSIQKKKKKINFNSQGNYLALKIWQKGGAEEVAWGQVKHPFYFTKKTKERVSIKTYSRKINSNVCQNVSLYELTSVYLEFILIFCTRYYAHSSYQLTAEGQKGQSQRCKLVFFFQEVCQTS